MFPPESTCLTKRSNAADVTLTDYSPCKGTSAFNNVTTSWRHKVQFRIRCWCVRSPRPYMSSYQILVSNTYLIFFTADDVILLTNASVLPW